MKDLKLKTKEINSKGITLVALVISIIVLLILATVSINIVINNEIIDKAQNGVNQYSEGDELEHVQSAVLSIEMKNKKLTTGNLNNELKGCF